MSTAELSPARKRQERRDQRRAYIMHGTLPHEISPQANDDNGNEAYYSRTWPGQDNEEYYSSTWPAPVDEHANEAYYSSTWPAPGNEAYYSSTWPTEGPNHNRAASTHSPEQDDFIPLRFERRQSVRDKLGRFAVAAFIIPTYMAASIPQKSLEAGWSFASKITSESRLARRLRNRR